MNQVTDKEFDPEGLVYKTSHTRTWNQTWRQFHEMFADPIVAYARRRGLDENSALDVLQEVMASVIRSQQGQEKGYDRKGGAFQAWVWGVIRHRVFEAFRRKNKTPLFEPIKNEEGEEKQDDGRDGIELPPDYAEMEEREWQLAIFDAAKKRVQTRVNPQKFAIFQALLNEEATPEELAVQTGKTRNNIDAIKHSCNKMIAEEGKGIQEEWELLRQDNK